jgi:hypothetical protein
VLIRPDGSDPKSNVIVVNIGDAGKVTYWLSKNFPGLQMVLDSALHLT